MGGKPKRSPLSLSIFHQPEVVNQPPGTKLWWGYGLHPERNGNFVPKVMNQCTGAEILEETLRHLPFGNQLPTIMASSICIPCDMPYVNNIWLPRNRGDRPPPVPEGSTNLGFIGQYVEMPREIPFTIECCVRSAWEAINVLLKRGPRRRPFIRAVRSEGAARRAEGVRQLVIRSRGRGWPTTELSGLNCRAA
jgi:oleate hydratase